MLNFLPMLHQDCERTSRRHFLQVGMLGSLGLTLPMALANRKAQAASNAQPTNNRAKKAGDVNCILIWSQGGVSHHDTLDPKPNAPANVRGEFGAIDTVIPGVKFTEIHPRMARVADQFGLLRGWNPQNGSHGHADAWVLSGRKFNASLIYPTYGSVISQHFGFKSVLPPFVQLGSSIDHRFNGGEAGILGQEHNPFEILTDPNVANFTVQDITPPSNINASRLDRRRQMLAQIDAIQRRADLQPEAYDALDEHYKTALNMVTSDKTKRAFQIDEENPKLRDDYGRTKFGQSLLLARRMLEAGVRFVTVSDGGWDTHQNNFKSLKDRLIPPVDQGLPALLEDLKQRGMLENTLVLWLSDFGRTPKINSASGRDHWASAGFAVMAGAGTPGGVLGATDEEGGQPTRNEYNTDDLAATIYTKLGLPTDMYVRAPDGRPIRLIEGHPIKEWV